MAFKIESSFEDNIDLSSNNSEDLYKPKRKKEEIIRATGVSTAQTLVTKN